MSIGNLKTEGNKGNNFPYQLRTLQLLGEIAASISAPSSRTPNILRSIIAEGIFPPVYSVSFYNAGTTDATVIAVVLKPGETINFDAGGSGNTFPGSSFSWVADATSELLVIFVS